MRHEEVSVPEPLAPMPEDWERALVVVAHGRRRAGAVARGGGVQAAVPLAAPPAVWHPSGDRATAAPSRATHPPDC
jgi:hypothetical protein